MAAGILWGLAACSAGGDSIESTAESCMTCHNGSPHDDYAGPGIENPHPFEGADNLTCTTCHGGNPKGEDKGDSHVPPPPQIGNEEFQETNFLAYFNRLTLAGMDKFPDYQVGGKNYTALDYLQFVNPGDLRIVTQGRACGQCHEGHALCVAGSPLATETGFFSGSSYAMGVENEIPLHQGLWEDTAADKGFRAVTDPDWTLAGAEFGTVGSLIEQPVYSVFNGTGPDQIHKNQAYDSDDLPLDVNADGSVVTGSHLANLFQEQVSFTCGDCHLGSAGANNRAGDFRSSGCSACHMPYSLGGRSGSSDPNIEKKEPLDPDDIDAPERAHLRKHRILSTARVNENGKTVQGIDDLTCAGCHQGSNRTVMQYWGIRLDQNQDVKKHLQYPLDPVSFKTTFGDQRLFDPAVKNKTFNGRNANQYLLFEDYDGDQRDDTPADVHYEAGMGCIDCHGSYDLHGGDVATATSPTIRSRMEQAVAIRCESCHGDADSYAASFSTTDEDGNPIEVALDSAGNPLMHVRKEAGGHFYLYSKLTGERHYVSQTRDVVVDSGRTNPLTGDAIYSAHGSYAMGRVDGQASTGIGPQQKFHDATGFSHMDNLSCAACHSSWTNTCIGCHLGGEYTTNANTFSNITGERIVFRQANADFVYQSPVPFQLGVGADGKIGVIAPNTDAFFQYRDLNGTFSQVFSFTDRNGGGNHPSRVQPSLAHNVMLQHSIRGRVTGTDEGARQCVACHLTDDALNQWGTEYDSFRTALATADFDALDFDLLATHIGANPGNQLNSPFWVHMVAGLGSGMFLFAEHGAAMNKIDDNDDRIGSGGTSPKDSFDPALVHYNLDRIVEPDGSSNGSSTHAFLDSGEGPALRDGALDPTLAGPLGATLVRTLCDPTLGVVLDSWIDADGDPGGNATDYVGGS